MGKQLFGSTADAPRVRISATDGWSSAVELDAPDAVLVRLDAQGHIVQVNLPWFARALETHQVAGDLAHVDRDYLAICSLCGHPGALALAPYLIELLSGHRNECEISYACHSATRLRWFRLRAVLPQDQRGGALLFHDDISELSMAQVRSQIQLCVADSFTQRKSLSSACSDLGLLVCDRLSWDYAALWTLDPTTWTLRCCELWMHPGLDAAGFQLATQAARLGPGIGLPGIAWRERTGLWVTDLDRIGPDSTTGEYGDRTVMPPAVLATGFRAGIAVPVKCGDDVLAVLELFSRIRQDPDLLLLHVLEACAVQIGIAELRNRAEQRAEAAQAEAAAAREQLESVLDCAPAIVVTVDRAGIIEFANRGIGRFERADLAGMAWKHCMAADQQDTVEQALAEVLECGASRTCELRIEQPDGGFARFMSYLGPMRSAHVITGVVIVCQDVTDFRRAQEDLFAAQHLASIGTLAAGIAHEINTPLQFIGDNIEFIRESTGDLFALIEGYQELRGAAERAAPAPELARRASELVEAEDRADLAYVQEQIPQALERTIDGLQRVTTIVRSMKEFAHPAQKEMAAVDLNRAIAATLTVARNEYKYVAELETDFGELPAVTCYVNDINQVVLNIVVNAAHAIEEVVKGTDKKGLIRVHTSCTGGSVVIAISDTGPGIPESARPRIFDPFFTTKEVGKGTGQGLAIAWTAVTKKHGGELTFTTGAGQGTTFFVRLPVDANCARPAAVDAPDQPD